MKRGIIILLFFAVFLTFLLSFTSADIIFNQPVNSVYNLGESVDIPLTIKSLNGFSGLFKMDLLCNGTAINFFSSYLSLTAGEEVTFSPVPKLGLINDIIGNEVGTCKIKALLGNEYSLSSEFKISDFLNVEASLEKTEFSPGENIAIKGKVTKESGTSSSGFIEAKILSDLNLSQSGTINNGNFEMNFVLPSNIESGNYIIQINAAEKDANGVITNEGGMEKSIFVKQVPTNLEIVIENSSIVPGNSLRFQTILHDQTGESISSLAVITVKDSNNKIIEQKEIQTAEFFEYSVKPNEAPATWRVYAVSNKLNAEALFNIEVKESIDIQIVNKTILIKNTGNVFYNKTILVKVGDNPVNLDVRLNVEESKKYALNAPDGDYDVSVSNGIDELIKKVSLTGRTIEIKEAGVASLVMVGWIVLVAVLAFGFILAFKRIYQKPFFLKALLGRSANKQKNDFKELSIEDNGFASRRGNMAELSLSIRGDKQDASVICVKIKELKEVKSKRGSASETVEKIMHLAEENKAAVYEIQDYLFLIFAPVKTRTFKNEKTALDVSEKISNILNNHNRNFNQKLDFGISLNSGAIIAKPEPDSFKFMSMGTLITLSKKIASVSNGEVLLSHEMNDLLRLTVKTEKEMRDGTSVFKITRIKRENEEARKFIDKFMHRQNQNR